VCGSRRGLGGQQTMRMGNRVCQLLFLTRMEGLLSSDIRSRTGVKEADVAYAVEAVLERRKSRTLRQ
jgi:hypothetical protein